MAALDDITDLAQDVYYTINGAENDDTGADLTTFQNEFIRGFNLWLDEYETEAEWNKLRDNDISIATIADTTTFSFPINTTTYRKPVFNQDKYVKFIGTDGSTVLARFKLVDPNQRVDDDPYASGEDRATFVNGNLVLSRAPNENEQGASIVLDLIRWHTRLTTTDATGITELPSKQLAVLGIAKNQSLANVTKVALSPSFAQKYNDELMKQKAINAASNETYDAQYSDYGYVNGSW